MARTQGALEYMLIIAAVLAVSAIVVVYSSGIFSVQNSSVNTNACREAAAKCSLLKKVAPNDPCSSCVTACKNQMTEAELFTGAIQCCINGDTAKIYTDSSGCTSLAPINLVINTPAAGGWTGTSSSFYLGAHTDISATCYSGLTSNPTTQMSYTGGLSHSQPLTGLTEGSATRYVRCTAGTQTEEKSVTWNVDTTPPSVSITDPTGGAVTGTRTVSVSASDSGSGVNNVVLYINGVQPSLPGMIDSSSPYSFSWATTDYNGTTLYSPYATTHTLKAKAYDNVGNYQFSSVVTVTVSNSCSGTLGKCSESCRFCTGYTEQCCHDNSWRFYCYAGSCPV